MQNVQGAWKTYQRTHSPKNLVAWHTPPKKLLVCSKSIGFSYRKNSSTDTWRGAWKTYRTRGVALQQPQTWEGCQPREVAPPPSDIFGTPPWPSSKKINGVLILWHGSSIKSVGFPVNLTWPISGSRHMGGVICSWRHSLWGLNDGVISCDNAPFTHNR